MQTSFASAPSQARAPDAESAQVCDALEAVAWACTSLPGPRPLMKANCERRLFGLSTGQHAKLFWQPAGHVNDQGQPSAEQALKVLEAAEPWTAKVFSHSLRDGSHTQA